MEVSKVTSRHIQCPGEIKGELLFLISLIRNGEIFPEVFLPTLMSDGLELGHIVQAEPLTGYIIGYRMAWSNLE